MMDDLGMSESQMFDLMFEIKKLPRTGELSLTCIRALICAT